MRIAEKQQQYQLTFASFDDVFDRYTYLLSLSPQLPPLPEASRQEQHLVSGCQSKVWLVLSARDGTLDLQADSDTLLLRGLLFVLRDTLHGAALEEIAEADLSVLWKLGLNDLFTDARNQGLKEIISSIRVFA